MENIELLNIIKFDSLIFVLFIIATQLFINYFNVKNSVSLISNLFVSLIILTI